MPLTIDEIYQLLNLHDQFESKQQYNKAHIYENSIKDQFVTYFDSFGIDFILESIERLGYNPALITDNTGEWYVNIEEMYIDDKNEAYCFPIQTEGYASTIKEAVRIFINTTIKNSIICGTKLYGDEAIPCLHKSCTICHPEQVRATAFNELYPALDLLSLKPIKANREQEISGEERGAG